MRHAYVPVLLILVVGLGRAGAQAPTPKALIDAKTAYLVNDGAEQDTFDGLARELRAWGRWTLVDDQAASDVTVTLGGFVAFKGWRFTVTDTKTKAPLWSAREKARHIEHVFVRDLRKRVEESTKH